MVRPHVHHPDPINVVNFCMTTSHQVLRPLPLLPLLLHSMSCSKRHHASLHRSHIYSRPQNPTATTASAEPAKPAEFAAAAPVLIVATEALLELLVPEELVPVPLLLEVDADVEEAVEAAAQAVPATPLGGLVTVFLFLMGMWREESQERKRITWCSGSSGRAWDTCVMLDLVTF